MPSVLNAKRRLFIVRVPATVSSPCHCVIFVISDYASIVDASSDIGQHVMTFFDRKVDLAQFDEDTPLYVMCREWMRNSPADSVAGTSAPALQEADREQTQVWRCAGSIVCAK